MTNKHVFALFVKDCSSKALYFVHENIILISDPECMLRITQILRLAVGDNLILFDEKKEFLCQVERAGKREIKLTILSEKVHTRIGASVTVFLPILKKDDFDAALYALAAVGVETIQLITTEKTQRSWQGAKDRTRSEKILIAAAEQSKYFSMPLLKDPEPLAKLLELSVDKKILRVLADPAGSPVSNLCSIDQKFDGIEMLVGPEGGLTDKELSDAQRANFELYRLTPTILKAEHAISILSGLLRSVFY